MQNVLVSECIRNVGIYLQRQILYNNKQTHRSREKER